MLLDSIRSTFDELRQECAKLADRAEQLFDDVDVLVHHVDLFHSNRAQSNANRATGNHEMHEFVAEELAQIRRLLEFQGQFFCQRPEGHSVPNPAPQPRYFSPNPVPTS